MRQLCSRADTRTGATVTTALKRLALASVLLCASCERASDGYVNLDPGFWTIYAVDDEVLGDRRTNRYVSANLPEQQFNGEMLSRSSSQASSLEYLRRTGAGIERVAHRNASTAGVVDDVPARTILPPTLELGESWGVTSSLGVIESRTFARRDRVIGRRYPVTINKHIAAIDERVVVPAGTFDGCLRIDGAGHTVVAADRGNHEVVVQVVTREWFAPGIGLIKLEREESSPSSFLKAGTQRWQLLDYGN